MNLHSVLYSLVVGFAALAIGHPLVSAQDDTTQDDTAATIKPTGKVELVQDGFAFTEGPAWEPKSKTLLFTDIPNTAIHRLHADGSISLFTGDSKHTNGILIPSDGRILACQMDGRVVRYDENANATVLASQYDGKRFNAPNDLTVDDDGGIYFTDPLFRAPTPLPQAVQAVYYIASDGTVSRVTEGLAAPNGIGMSPDRKRLYVCPSQQAEMLVYEVTGPGKLSQPKTFCTVEQPEGQSGTGADGIALDVQGNVYITTHIGVQIFSPAGEQIGVVSFPQQPANVCFGGDDWKTMFVTARTGLYRVTMPIPGLH
ncbi:SMP-30/gluconolactonase/LRE family protein [Stieleria sp. ICT_E10.1]|uniref:SMP-30/gluconolactonase/LRE family protein n=1 Tax=Stieleria sedimenti TaxID=2976331 RepID=UPI00217FB34C|nr:SMP-30/gluconolactonase/LRE family protein [Stieleria sedimenti]MCS7466490.1 SMP-30/gluconolactonase/LRE family protein [Stieleria sedimenti]